MMNEIFLPGYINSVRNVTVEPRLIYTLKGAYMGRPKIVYRLKGLYAVGGKILYGGERFYYGRFALIIIGFQLIIQGRAKILHSAVMVICSREVVYGCEGIMQGRTNHYYGL